MSIEISRHTEKRSERTLICSSGCNACEGQALALQEPGCVFFVVRGTGPRNRCLILAILHILAILLQTRILKTLLQTLNTREGQALALQVTRRAL